MGDSDTGRFYSVIVFTLIFIFYLICFENNKILIGVGVFIKSTMNYINDFVGVFVRFIRMFA